MMNKINEAKRMRQITSAVKGLSAARVDQLFSKIFLTRVKGGPALRKRQERAQKRAQEDRDMALREQWQIQRNVAAVDDSKNFWTEQSRRFAYEQQGRIR